jgi:hypothetical protein
MNSPRTETEWEDLFGQNLPDVPVPVAVSRHVRATVRLELSQQRALNRTPVRPIHPLVNAVSRFFDRLMLMTQYARTHVAVLWTVSMVSLLLISLVAIGGAPRSARAAASVRVHGGTATLIKASTGQERVLPENTEVPIEPGDEIATQTGTAVITYFEGQTSTVSPNARVKLVALAQERGGKRVELAVWQGRAEFQFGVPLGPNDNFRITSPSSSAQVQDTQVAMTVDVRSDKETRYVAGAGAGSATVTMGDKTVNMHAGEQVTASSGGNLESEPVVVAQIPPTSIIVPTTPVHVDNPPTSAPVPTATDTATPYLTQTPTALPTRVNPPTNPPTNPPQPTNPPAPTPTDTPVPMPTNLPAPQPVPTATPIVAPTQIPMPTSMAAPTATSRPTATPLPTDTPYPTDTPLPTDTPYPTDTPIPTDTATPEPPTATPISPTATTPPPTATPLPPTATTAATNTAMLSTPTPTMQSPQGLHTATPTDVTLAVTPQPAPVNITATPTLLATPPALTGLTFKSMRQAGRHS